MALSTIPQTFPAPIVPDFNSCNPVYGEGILVRDCQQVIRQIMAMPFSTRFEIPITISSGTCHAKIEKAGPIIMERMTIIRSKLVDMAGYLMGQCVVRENGMGGFITNGLTTLVRSLLMTPRLPSAQDIYPVSTSFITLTIYNVANMEAEPGNYDPAVPLTFANFHNFALTNLPNLRTGNANLLPQKAAVWTAQAERMGAGEAIPWWQVASSITDDEMTYECDAGLGSPSEVDCAQIEWHQLDFTPSDTLTIGPNQVSFYHSNTCYMAISSAVSVTLTWDQIRTALATLVSVCINNPTHASQGGRAFYGAPSALKVARRRKRQPDVTGWNALPPGANITFFNQLEPWTDQETELKTCTWNAILRGVAVSTCHT